MRHAKEYVTGFWISLSKAAHKGSGDHVTDDTIEETYRYQPPAPQFATMTNEQIEFARRMSKVDEIAHIHNYYEYAPQINAAMGQKLAEGAKKIKESHDRILGINPDDMNLKNYFSNAGLLYIDAITREQNKMVKDGTLRYTSQNYKGMVNNNGSLPRGYETAFNHDDYVPLEARIKEQYVRAKARMMQNSDGSISPAMAPPQVDPDKEQARSAFLSVAMEGIQS